MKNKLYKILQIVLLILLALSSGFLIYSLVLFTGLKKLYIVLLITLVCYISLFVGYLINKNYRLGRPKRFLAISIISIILVGIYVAGSYLLTNLHSKLDNFSKDEITYKTVLLTFNNKYKTKEDVKDSKIGIVEDKEDYELYILPMKVISEDLIKSNNEIKKYNSIIDLMSALYKEEVDLIFINSNYKDLFISFEEYNDLSEKTIEILDYSEKKEIKKENSKTNVEGKALTKPFTLLILGVDSTSDVNAAFNGDTIMIVTFNPKTLNATMFSIPRDTYAKIACGNRQFQKINTSAYGGARCVINTVQNITGIDIDYYIKINFKGVVDLVDALGGVEVDVPYAFCEQNSTRSWGDKTVYVYEKGLQVLNGEQALALSRNRHSADNYSLMKKYCPTLTEGTRNDFVRGKNQQLVIEGILKKVKEIRNVNKLLEILDVISKNIDTDLSTDEMFSFYEVLESLIGAKGLDLVNIQKTFLRGYDMNVWEPNVEGYRYAFFNYKGSMNDIVTLMKQNLEITKPNIIKTFSYSIEKPYEQELVGNKTYNESKLPTVPNFSRYTYSQAKDWASRNGKTIHFINYDTNEELSSITGMNFVSQSMHERTLVVKSGDTLNLYYANKKVQNTEEAISE